MVELNVATALRATVEPARKAASGLVTSTVSAQDVSAWQQTGMAGAEGRSDCAGGGGPCWWCSVGRGAPPEASCLGVQRDSPAAKPR